MSGSPRKAMVGAGGGQKVPPPLCPSGKEKWCGGVVQQSIYRREGSESVPSRAPVDSGTCRKVCVRGWCDTQVLLDACCHVWKQVSSKGVTLHVSCGGGGDQSETVMGSVPAVLPCLDHVCLAPSAVPTHTVDLAWCILCRWTKPQREGSALPHSFYSTFCV